MIQIEPEKRRNIGAKVSFTERFFVTKKIIFEMRLTDLDLLFILTKEQIKIATREHCLLARSGGLQYYDGIGTLDDLIAALFTCGPQVL